MKLMMICPRCLKESPAEVHTCTPTDFVRELERQIAECERERDELVAALKAFDYAAKSSGSIIGFAAQALKLIQQARAALAKVGADKTG